MKRKSNIKEGVSKLRQSAYSQEIILCFKNPISINEIERKINNFLYDVTTYLKNNGCKLIGHIKALLDAEKDGCLFFSMTSFDKRPRCKGTIINEIEVARLKINIIVYGTKSLDIEKAVNERITIHFQNEAI